MHSVHETVIFALCLGFLLALGLIAFVKFLSALRFPVRHPVNLRFPVRHPVNHLVFSALANALLGPLVWYHGGKHASH